MTDDGRLTAHRPRSVPGEPRPPVLLWGAEVHAQRDARRLAAPRG